MRRKDKMLCEDDGMPLVWRCTNQVTNVAKYKCPYCGRLYKIVVEPKEKECSDKLEKPLYYHKNSYGTYTVHRNLDKKYQYYGTYSSEDIAKAVVDKLWEYGWNKDLLGRIREELGLTRRGKQWVWT